jgi:hypothetical protein
MSKYRLIIRPEAERLFEKPKSVLGYTDGVG